MEKILDSAFSDFLNVHDALIVLQPEVAKWSLENFGDQSYRNPLEGMGEEIGELSVALISNNKAEIRDALADIMIFMMDFASRYRICLPPLIRDWGFRNETYIPDYARQLISEHPTYSLGLMSLVVGYGELLQGIVKRDQGIRMDRWLKVEKGLAQMVFGAMYLSINDADGHLDEIIKDTWANIVSRRTAEPLKVRG